MKVLPMLLHIIPSISLPKRTLFTNTCIPLDQVTEVRAHKFTNSPFDANFASVSFA